MGLGAIDIVELILWVIFVDFIFCGMIIASAMWFICNKVHFLILNRDLTFFLVYAIITEYHFTK